jgi:hypothetical protein
MYSALLPRARLRETSIASVMYLLPFIIGAELLDQ